MVVCGWQAMVCPSSVLLYFNSVFCLQRSIHEIDVFAHIFLPMFFRTIFVDFALYTSIARKPSLVVLQSAKDRVCVLQSTDEFQAESAKLASSLGLDVVVEGDIAIGLRPENESFSSVPWEFALVIEPYFLSESALNPLTYAVGVKSLQKSIPPSRNASRRKPSKSNTSKPFYVDFCPPTGTRLKRRIKGGGDLLAKAVGPRKGVFSQQDGAIIYDLTAGLGQDALLLANAGAKKVVMFERNPIVGALLKDALRRLDCLAGGLDSTTIPEDLRSEAEILSRKLFVQVADGQESLATRGSSLAEEFGRCDIIYLDPMFPTRTKSASVKKNMQILQALLESQVVDEDAREADEQLLLKTALQYARHRVVVKRPVSAPFLGGSSTPSHDIRGTTSRWDVYATN